MSRSRFPAALVAFAIILSLGSSVGAWGSSVHHDTAIILYNAFYDSPSIPNDVRDNLDSDAIYSASLAPDDWRNATSQWGTYQYNMAENGYYEFLKIRDAWEFGDYDNAIMRVGAVLHYVGDAIQMAHNQDLRDWYNLYITPIGSDEPLWASEESGQGEYSHQVRQQIERYTDGDSAWYPIKPENYGTIENSALGVDDGSLDWFLAYFYDPAIDNDSPNSPGESNIYENTVMGRHIIQTSPYIDDSISTEYKDDNRWFYWVETRDIGMSKMDADNTIRLTYNGVYRAIRDAYLRVGDNSDNSEWPWPSVGEFSSLNDNLYAEGMDSVRWYEGTHTYGSETGDNTQYVSPSQRPAIPVLFVALAVIVSIIFIDRHRKSAKKRAGMTS